MKPGGFVPPGGFVDSGGLVKSPPPGGFVEALGKEGSVIPVERKEKEEPRN